MVFSSLVFLFVFLPIVLLIYFASPKKLKNLVLLISSLIFYAWGEPVYIFIMIISSIVDYTHGLIIEKNRLNKSKAKMALVSSILINLGLLSFFKYADFLIVNINNIAGTSFTVMNLPLPIGISFYTFQTMSYTIDVYRGKVKAQRNPIALATYVTLFPQLIAGPIVRYSTIAEQLENRTSDLKHVGEGIRRFIAGLGKKVLIANNVGWIWSEILKTDMAELSVATAWLGLFAFGLQIYFDFSGYSDMAIGLGKIFGFDFMENFNYPYISKSITEFWRRWHMSLSTWFKDYVYIPLGGSRGSKIAHIRNILIIWFITGLWHGASWNFVLWGLYFGIIITIEKIVYDKLSLRIPYFIRHFYVIVLLLIGWVLFLFEDLSAGMNYYKVIFGLNGNAIIDSQFIYYIYSNLVVLVVGIIGSTPLMKHFKNRLYQNIEEKISTKIAISTYYVLILFISAIFLVEAGFNPFLYFRF